MLFFGYIEEKRAKKESALTLRVNNIGSDAGKAEWKRENFTYS